MLTIGIVTHSRLHYFRATVESLSHLIEFGVKIEVVDNCSNEKGYDDYLQEIVERGFIVHRFRCSHPGAMNFLIAKADTKYLMLWPDDIQFITREYWVDAVLDILEENTSVGSLSLNFLRRSTLSKLLKLDSVSMTNLLNILSRRRIRNPKIHFTKSGVAYYTVGSNWPAVCPSGLPAIHRVSTLRALGPWLTAKKSKLIDSSGGAEDDYRRRANRAFPWLDQAVLATPLALDIINDDRGGKARVRSGVRYGRYAPPSDGSKLYYPIAEYWKTRNKSETVLSIEDIASALDIELPRDSSHNVLKANCIDTSIQVKL